MDDSITVYIKFKTCKYIQDIIILIDESFLVEERSDWFDITRVYYGKNLENKFSVVGDLIYLEIIE